MSTTEHAAPVAPALAPVPGTRHDIWVDPTTPTTLRMRGEVDIATVHRFCTRTHPRCGAASTGRALARAGVRDVDVRDVTFADSAFASLLAGLLSGAYPDRVRLRGGSPSVRLVLESTGLAPYVELRG